MSTLTASQVRRRFLLLTALRWLPVGLAIPVTILVMTQRGLGPGTIGLVVAAQGALVLLLELPTGGLADAIGRRPVLVAAGAAHVTGLAVFLVARDPWVFALASACKGVFRALDSGPLQAWYVDAAQADDPDADIETGLARAGVLIGGSIAVGSAMSAGVAWLGRGLDSGDGALLTAASLPIVVAMAMALLQALLVVALVREVGRPRGWPALQAGVRDVPRVLRHAAGLVRVDLGIRLLLVIEVAWAVGQTGMELLWPARLAEMVGGTDQAAAVAGVVSVAMWVAAAGGAASVPWAQRRLGTPGRVGAASRVVQGAGMLALAVAGGPVLLTLALAAGLVGNGAGSPVHQAMLHRRVDASARTTLLSVNSLAAQGGAMVGTAGMGALAAAAGIPIAWVVGGVLLLASAPLYLRVGAPVTRPAPAAGPVPARPAPRSAARR